MGGRGTPTPSPREAASVESVLARARRRLAETPFGASTREASLLLAHVLGVDEVEVLAHGERELATGAKEVFQGLLTRRLAGEPVAYLTGRREFYGRSFRVDRRALIPRPESEHLIELALELDLPEAPTVLDIGTGTGCLALTLALEVAGSRVTATDRSVEALSLAAENRRLLGAGRARLVAADLARGLDVGRFDLVVSNPPYIAPDEIERISSEITAYEPRSALLSPDPGGTGVTGRLLGELRDLPGGARVLLEIGASQFDAVSELAVAAGFDVQRLVTDYAGLPRVVSLRRRCDR